MAINRRDDLIPIDFNHGAGEPIAYSIISLGQVGGCMRSTILLFSASSIALAGLVACTGPAMPDRSEGRAFFSENCTSCHGQGGTGDGDMAKGLPVSPTDLTMLSRANGGTFPATRALAYIWGDPKQSHLARVMPQFGGAMAEDLVPVKLDGVFTPTPRALSGLLTYLESIQQ